MGSSEYLDTARRAGIVFTLLAIVALGAAGFRLAALIWDKGDLAAAPAPLEKHSVDSHGRSPPGLRRALRARLRKRSGRLRRRRRGAIAGTGRTAAKRLAACSQRLSSSLTIG